MITVFPARARSGRSRQKPNDPNTASRNSGKGRLRGWRFDRTEIHQRSKFSTRMELSISTTKASQAKQRRALALVAHVRVPGTGANRFWHDAWLFEGRGCKPEDFRAVGAGIPPCPAHVNGEATRDTALLSTPRQQTQCVGRSGDPGALARYLGEWADGAKAQLSLESHLGIQIRVEIRLHGQQRVPVSLEPAHH